MNYYLNYSGGRMNFSLPSEWNVLSSQDCAKAPLVEDAAKEVERALDNPIGTPPLEQLARPGMKAAVLFDDMQRPTPAHLAFPAILNRLNKAGVPDERITAICARGTHPSPSPEQIDKKVGRKRFAACTAAFTSTTPSRRKMFLSARPAAERRSKSTGMSPKRIWSSASARACPIPMPDTAAGARSSCPEFASYRTIGDHHYNWLRNKSCKLSVLEGNPWYDEIVEIARLGGLAFKVDFLLNETNQVIRAFAGDPVEEHRQACESRCLSLSCCPAETGGYCDHFRLSSGNRRSGDQIAAECQACRQDGGTIIWVAARNRPGPLMSLIEQMAAAKSANEYHRRLLERRYPGQHQTFRHFVLHARRSLQGIVGTIQRDSRDGRIDQGAGGIDEFRIRFTTLDEAIQQVQKSMPKADVTILPSGGTIIPVGAVGRLRQQQSSHGIRQSLEICHSCI